MQMISTWVVTHFCQLPRRHTYHIYFFFQKLAQKTTSNIEITQNMQHQRFNEKMYDKYVIDTEGYKSIFHWTDDLWTIQIKVKRNNTAIVCNMLANNWK